MGTCQVSSTSELLTFKGKRLTQVGRGPILVVSYLPKKGRWALSGTLVLIESTISPEQAAFIARLYQSGNTLVIARGFFDLGILHRHRVEWKTISDYVQPSGLVYDNLFLKAIHLVATWKTRPALAQYLDALKHDGFSIWDMIEWQFVISVQRALVRVEVLRQVLTSNTWSKVYIAGSGDTLREAFQFVTSANEFQGEIFRVEDVLPPALEQYLLPPFNLRIEHYLAIKRLINCNPVTQELNIKRLLFTHKVKSKIAFIRAIGEVRLKQLFAVVKRYSLQRALQSSPGQERPGRQDRQDRQAASPSLRQQKSYIFLLRNNDVILKTLFPIVRSLESSSRVMLLGYELGYARRFSSDIFLDYPVTPLWLSRLLLTSWRVPIAWRKQTIQHNWQKLSHDAQAQAAFSDEERSLWPILKKPLSEVMVGMAQYTVPWIEVLKHLFTTYQPSVVVSGTDRDTQTIAAAAVARRFGIPSVYVQQARHGDGPYLRNLFTDYAAVMDEFTRTAHMKCSNVSADRFVLTGLPRWDNIAQVMARVQAERDTLLSSLYRDLGIDPGERIIVFASQPLALELRQRTVQILMQTLAAYPNTRLIIKLHPNEDSIQSTFEKIVAESPPTALPPRVIRRTNLYALLLAAEMVITFFSNVGLEAVMLDRPVMLINLSGEPDLLPLVQQKTALGAYSEAEIAHQINRLLSDPAAARELQASRRLYLQANSQITDGKATERVVEMLRSLAQHGDLSAVKQAHTTRPAPTR